MAIFQTTPTMSRKEIIEKIKKDTGCDDVQANRIFELGDRALTKVDLVTLLPDDILQSRLFGRV